MKIFVYKIPFSYEKGTLCIYAYYILLYAQSYRQTLRLDISNYRVDYLLVKWQKFIYYAFNATIKILFSVHELNKCEVYWSIF